jgi:hypothetical protein
MKTTHFLFAMISCAVLTQGIVHAGPSSATVSDHQPGSSPPAATALGDFVGNKVANNSAVRPTSAIPPTGTSPKKTSNPGSGAVVIGGPANPTKNTAAISGKSASPTKNTAAINGTGMNHKH